jgi:hypothetical protein
VLDPRFLVTREWLRAPGSPRRVQYLMEQPDGRRALKPLASTRGVRQSLHHHLDVFDHTLLVLAYLEALLEAPLEGFLDPARLDRQVAEALRNQGMNLLPIPAPAANPGPPDVSETRPYHDRIRVLLERALNAGDSALLLKWTALLHDVGKPGTRVLNQTGRGPKVQFPGHEVYGLKLLEATLNHLFAEDCPKHGPMKPAPGFPSPPGAAGTARGGWVCARCGVRREQTPASLRSRIATLIRRHHDHHQIGQRYAQPGRLGILQAMLRDGRQDFPGLDYTGPPAAEELAFLAKFTDPVGAGGPEGLALLLLHGYADSLACRGPETKLGITRVAEIDLTFLALATVFGQLKSYGEWEKTFQDLLSGMVPELGIPGQRFGAVKPELRAWYFQELRDRKRTNGSGPTRVELLDRARALVQRV